MDRSNLFNPFVSRPNEHEDRLTWAFLVAVKYDPSLQNFLRELVESRLPPKLREYSNTWEPARVSTQTKWIESTTNLLVSVLLTDAPIQEEIMVEWSDREPRYDGVIEYPDGLTLVVENKPFHGNVREEQLSPSRKSFSGDIEDDPLHDRAICLEWSEILESVLKYVASGIAPFSSREIARDLLSFVEEVRPELTPYRTFKLCGDRREALDRRRVRLLDALAIRVNLETRKGQDLLRPKKIAERVGIWVESSSLKVSLWPASTARQADRFCKEVDKERFLSLNEQGWAVRPNLNFSFKGTKLLWAITTWETRRYWEYFFSDERPYGRKDWNELSLLIEEWRRQGLITSCINISGDHENIEDQRTTNRQYLDVNPEFEISREWNLDTVIELEKQAKLEEHIIDALNAALATWGETL